MFLARQGTRQTCMQTNPWYLFLQYESESYLKSRPTEPAYLKNLVDQSGLYQKLWTNIGNGRIIKLDNEAFGQIGMPSVTFFKVLFICVRKIWTYIQLNLLDSSNASFAKLCGFGTTTTRMNSHLVWNTTAPWLPTALTRSLRALSGQMQVGRWITLVLCIHISTYAWHNSTQGVGWFDWVQVLLMNPELQRLGQTKKRTHNPIIAPDGTSIKYEPDYYRHFYKVCIHTYILEHSNWKIRLTFELGKLNFGRFCLYSSMKTNAGYSSRTLSLHTRTENRPIGGCIIVQCGGAHAHLQMHFQCRYNDVIPNWPHLRELPPSHPGK